MYRQIIIFKVLLALTIFVGCAHYPDVRPSSNGDHTVSFLTDGKGEGYKEAFKQAKDYCEDIHEKKAFHTSEKSQYVGKTMDEESYNRAKSAAKLTNSFGAKALLGKKKSGKSAISVGKAADDAIGKGYQYTMKFKCN